MVTKKAQTRNKRIEKIALLSLKGEKFPEIEKTAGQI